MKKRRIACLTYHKYPGEDWPRDEFIATEVHMASWLITIRLAERGTKLSNGLWVREFRKLCESGHQTAFLSTATGHRLRCWRRPFASHPLVNTSSDEALKHLCAEINATETQFPGTELRLTYELVSAQSH